MNIDEYLDSRLDCCYFINSFVKVSCVEVFKLYDHQRKLIDFYNDNDFVVFKHNRQEGFSIVTALYWLWKCLFGHNHNVLFISPNERQSSYLMNTVKYSAMWLPNYLCMLNLSSRGVIKFHTGNFMTFVNKDNSDDLRGKNFTDLVVDNCDFVKNIDTLWVDLNKKYNFNKIFVYSSVGGQDSWFKTLYNDSTGGALIFNKFVSSRLLDECDNEWVGERGALLKRFGW